MIGTGLPILYEDDWLLALDKPAGLHSVQLEQGGGPSLAELLLTHHPALEAVSSRSGDAGLVQRLDFETSGVILCAKTRETWLALRAQLTSGEVKKFYLAVLGGEMRRSRAVSSYVGSRTRSAKRVQCAIHPSRHGFRGLPGTTSFEPIQHSKLLNASLVRAEASPARRHQIRAHAALIGLPLVGDNVYGASDRFPMEMGISAFLLHAERISFRHPIRGDERIISSPVPDSFQKLFPSQR